MSKNHKRIDSNEEAKCLFVELVEDKVSIFVILIFT